MLTIRYTAIEQPPRQSFVGVQATGGYGFRREPAPQSFRFALPCERLHYDDDTFAHLARRAPLALSVAADGQTLSDLAVAAVEAVVGQAGPQARVNIAQLIVAQATLNQLAGESVAGRMQHVLALKHIVPFALGQCGTLGLYAALPLAQGLLNTGETMLFVAADKLLHPFVRVYGDFVAYEDGAAAALLHQGEDEQAAGARVLGYSLKHGEAISSPWSRHPAELERQLAALAIEAARNAMHEAGVVAGQIECFAPGSFSASYRSRLAQALGIPAERMLAGEDAAHLASADTLRSLARAQAQVQTRLAPGERQFALFCDAALAGCAGALVVELRAVPHSVSSTRNPS
jgi:3-oxoacyl-[acyl-carrier-protein] synthase III